MCHLFMACFWCLLISHVDTNQPNPYVRSMTPSLVPTHRYPNPNPNRDARYINSHSVAASSSNSSIAQPAYETQNQYYDAPYVSPEYRTQIANHPHPRIPTPSEIANSYSNYPHHMTTPQSPTIPEEPYTSSSVDYPAPPHMVHSHAQGIHSHRPRIVTGRPRTASAAASTSPISASSPSGERFPCDKCGKTFSRSHDRKRHHETQHLISPVIHSCKYCGKEFSR